MRWQHSPPVPLEALLDAPSPRAAMLWTRPSHAERVAQVKEVRGHSALANDKSILAPPAATSHL
jgi:hypothetical protein